MATNKKNKVKFGLQNVYWAKINEWGEDPDGNKTVPAYGPSKHLPGAVSLSIDANGEAENFYADNGVYYVINNNAGYTGDLEIALITTEFATEILGEILDNNGVLVEKNDTELAQFALMFEFLGDKHHIRHVMYCCSASRPATESATTEESTEVKTEKLSLKATPLPTGLVKSKTTEVTEGDENKSEIGIESLEVFENIAYIIAKHAESNVPDNPEDFLEQFNTFSIYEILPQLIELWGLNTATQIESKKNIARLTAR